MMSFKNLYKILNKKGTINMGGKAQIFQSQKNKKVKGIKSKVSFLKMDMSLKKMKKNT